MSEALDTKTLRRFGIYLAIILGVIGGLLLWRGRVTAPYFLGAGGLSLVLGLIWPRGLVPVHRFLLWLGDKLAWINSRIILTVVFFLIFTPVSLFLKMIGKDLLEARIQKDRDSYWEDPEPEPEGADAYRRQF